PQQQQPSFQPLAPRGPYDDGDDADAEKHENQSAEVTCRHERLYLGQGSLMASRETVEAQVAATQEASQIRQPWKVGHGRDGGRERRGAGFAGQVWGHRAPVIRWRALVDGGASQFHE